MAKLVKLSFSLLLVVLMIMLVSCEALFTTNLFGDLDKLDLSNMSDREKAVAVLDDTAGAIEGMSSSQIAELISDLNALAADTSGSNDTRMQAAAASSAVQMSSSGADDTINNLGGMASDMANGDLVIDDPSDILTSIFSDSNGNPLSGAAITAQLDAMIASAAALKTYGSIIGDSGNPPAGVSADELAVTAMVVGLVDILVTGGSTTAEIAAAIVDPNPETAIDALPGTFPDISDMTADGGMDTLFGADLANTIESSGMVSSLLGMMDE
jgi:hypothetical protein